MMQRMIAMGSGGESAITPNERLYVVNSQTASQSYTPTKDVLAMLVFSGYAATFKLFEDGTQVWTKTTVGSTDGWGCQWDSYLLSAGKAYTIQISNWTYAGADNRYHLITMDN